MSTDHRLPPFRNLDIYLLVVVRGAKQLHVAKSFGVDPSRISQVIRRVRDWVDDCVSEWLFPGRDDLRFCVALELEKIRVIEHPDSPETVTLTSPARTYTRRFNSKTLSPHQPDTQASANSDSLSPADSESSPIPNAQPNHNLTPQPINSASRSSNDPLATTPDATTDSLNPDILQLGTHIAKLLIHWKKYHNLSDALKPPRSTQTSTR